MKVTRSFTVEEIEDIEPDYGPNHIGWGDVFEEHRWYTDRELIFGFEGQYWLVIYSDPATETQEDQSRWYHYGEDGPIEAVAVELKEVVVQKWEPIDA